jgi:hypothetical protein
MKRKELAEKLLENLERLEDRDEKLAWAEAFCNEVIDNYWLSFYNTPVSDPERGGFTFSVCALCGNHGVVHSRCFTPSGIPVDRKLFCICPNGQSLRKLGRDPNLCYCPTEKDFNKPS